jgi:hypothetical protein
MPRFPSVIEGSFENSEDAVCRRSALAYAVGALISLAVVRLMAGLGAGEGGVLGKTLVPIPRSYLSGHHIRDNAIIGSNPAAPPIY